MVRPPPGASGAGASTLVKHLYLQILGLFVAATACMTVVTALVGLARIGQNSRTIQVAFVVASSILTTSLVSSFRMQRSGEEDGIVRKVRQRVSRRLSGVGVLAMALGLHAHGAFAGIVVPAWLAVMGLLLLGWMRADSTVAQLQRRTQLSVDGTGTNGGTKSR